MGNKAQNTPQQAAVLSDHVLDMVVTNLRPLSMDWRQWLQSNDQHPPLGTPFPLELTGLMERTYEDIPASEPYNKLISLTTDFDMAWNG